MGKTVSKTHGDERTKPSSKSPKVVGLGYFSNLCRLTDVDTSNSYVVFLNKRDPKHIDKLIKFVNTLDEKSSKES